MHEFERRMEQYLATLEGLTEGHKDRLLRPLKQADLRCWEGVEDASSVTAMKAALRSIAHELLDVIFLQIEGAMSRCELPYEKVLLAALAAHRAPAWSQVLFREGERLWGVSYPSGETIVIEPGARIDSRRVSFVVEAWPGGAWPLAAAARLNSASGGVRRIAVYCAKPGGPDVRNSMDTISFSEAEIEADPFRCAAEVYRRLT